MLTSRNVTNTFQRTFRRETAEIIGKVAFKMFLGVTCDVTNWNSEGTSFSLILNENPLTDFVELPPQYEDLQYCALLCVVCLFFSLTFFA